MSALALAKIDSAFGVGEFTSTPAYLAKRVQLVDGAGTIDFNLLQNGNNPAAGLERFLNMDDAFVVTHWGLFLLNEVVANIGQAQKQTYENNTEFTVTGVTVKNLGKLYNGGLSVAIGQNKLIDGYPTCNFRVVPTTQQASATTRSEVAPRDGYAESMPLVVLSGKGKNTITVNRPASSGEGVQATDTSVNIIYAVLVAQGYTVFGGADKAMRLYK